MASAALLLGRVTYEGYAEALALQESKPARETLILIYEPAGKEGK